MLSQVLPFIFIVGIEVISACIVFVYNFYRTEKTTYWLDNLSWPSPTMAVVLVIILDLSYKELSSGAKIKQRHNMELL